MPDGWEPYRPPGRASRGARAERDPSTEEELWRRLREQGSLEARDALVEMHGDQAKGLAARVYSRRARNEIEFEEYHHFALIGLLEAIERFDPGLGVQFRTYASSRILGAIHDGLATMTERHQQLATRQRLAGQRTASLVPEHMALGDPEKLLGQLGDVAVQVALGFILDGLGLGPESRDGMRGNAYAEAELGQLRRVLWAAVERLEQREREILELHYKRGRQFTEIARLLGVSKGRVSQLHGRAMARLRALLGRARGCDVAY